MPFNTKCPVGHKLAVPSRFAGQTIACPKCKAKFVAEAIEPSGPQSLEPANSKAPPQSPTSPRPPSPPKSLAASVIVAEVAAEVAPPPDRSDVAEAARTAVAPAPPPPDIDHVESPPAEPVLANGAPPPAPPVPAERPASSPTKQPRMVFAANVNRIQRWLSKAITFSAEAPRGVEHRPEQLHALYTLSAVTFFLAIFSTVPAWLDVAAHFSATKSNGVATWAYVVLLIGGLQCIYAIYASQFADWSSAWILTGIILLVAMLYAMAFGSLLIGAEDSGLVQFLELQDRLQNARLWCCCVLGLMSIVAYFGGRFSARWCHDFRYESNASVSVHQDNAASI